MSPGSHRTLAKLKLRSRTLLTLQLRGFPGGLAIPFHVFVGRASKPRLLLIAGVHGDEYESVAALHDIASEINPNDLSGTLIIVPVANPQAFYAGMRRNPVDLGDLNRSFPGNPEGTTSERVADLLFQNLVLGSDGVLSMHCWGKEANSCSLRGVLGGSHRGRPKELRCCARVRFEVLAPIHLASRAVSCRRDTARNSFCRA